MYSFLYQSQKYLGGSFTIKSGKVYFSGTITSGAPEKYTAEEMISGANAIKKGK
jgi:hypothetical protein